MHPEIVNLLNINILTKDYIYPLLIIGQKTDQVPGSNSDYPGAKGIQSTVDILISAVDLLYVLDG